MLKNLLGLVAPVIVAFGLVSSAAAEDVILTVTKGDEVTTFDRESLSDLGLETIVTSTIWTEGTQVFEGVPLKALVEKFDVTDGMIDAWAINDYLAEIPLTDAVENGPILALTLNGAEMSVRDKGPIWIIYPYDQDAMFRSEVVYARSVWQLDRIEFLE